MKEKCKVKIPEVCFCSDNCTSKGGCIYWEPYKKDSYGKTYCNYFGNYFYPSKRQGCIHFKSLY